MKPRPPSFAPLLRRRVLATLPLALLLPGCAGVSPRPSTTSTVPTPSRWTQAEPAPAVPLDTAALAEWWRGFQDPVLNRLITDALARNPDIRTALSRIAQSRAARAVEKSGLFPSLEARLSGQSSRTRDRQTDSVTTRETYSASLDANWEIDLFGRQRLELAASTSDLAQTEENFHAAQVSLAAEVALAYLDLRSAEGQLAVVRRALDSREETARLTQWREEAGVGDILATRQALSSLEQARASIPALEQTLAETRNQLAILCARAPGALDLVLTAKATLPHPPATLAVGIPAETLRQRPDLRTASHAVQAAATRSESARRERLPSLNLTGTLGAEDGDLGRIFSPSATVASVVGGLVGPIFSAGRVSQNIRIQDEVTRQSLIAYEAAVLNALAEVENALGSIGRNGERLAALRRATDAAREADTLARRRYEAGAVDFLQVLDAERTLLSLEQSLVSTTADLGSAYVQLYKALGGGWSAAGDATVPSADSQT